MTITYVAGYGTTAADVPESARNAILYLVKHRFEQPAMFEQMKLHPVDETYNAIVDGLRWGDYR